MVLRQCGASVRLIVARPVSSPVTYDPEDPMSENTQTILTCQLDDHLVTLNMALAVMDEVEYPGMYDETMAEVSVITTVSYIHDLCSIHHLYYLYDLCYVCYPCNLYFIYNRYFLYCSLLPLNYFIYPY